MSLISTLVLELYVQQWIIHNGGYKIWTEGGFIFIGKSGFNEWFQLWDLIVSGLVLHYVSSLHRSTPKDGIKVRQEFRI